MDRSILRLNVLLIVVMGSSLISPASAAPSPATRIDSTFVMPIASWVERSQSPGSIVATAPWQPTVTGPVKPFSFDGDLRDLPAPKLAGPGQSPAREIPPPRELRGARQANTQALDPNVQQEMGASAMPTPSLTFDGLSNDNNANVIGYRVTPPDTNGDVGPNHYIQFVNLLFAVYSKSGATLAGPTQLSSLFAAGPTGTPCDTRNDGDPIALYDPMADRWLLSEFAIPGPKYYECIAVSKTPDPVSGGWWLYVVQSPFALFNDYPKLSVWPDAYYMTANMFPDDPNVQPFAAIWAMERSAMLAGRPARSIYFALNGYFSVLPANLRGDAPPSSSPAFFLSASEPGALNFWELAVDWANPLNSTLTGPTALTVNAFSTLCPGVESCVPQPGTSRGLDSLSSRLMAHLQYRRVGNAESLWANHTINSGGLAAIRWYEIGLSRSGGLVTPAINQQGTYAPGDGVWRWMGSIAADKDGNVSLGYSASNLSVYPGIRYAGRLAGDTADLLPQAEVTMTAGSGSQTGSSRWGDYSAMTVDPVDDCTFWYTNEYLTTTSPYGWTTKIGKWKYPSCAALPVVGAITGAVYNSLTLTHIPYAPIVALNLPMTRTYSGAADANGVYTLTVLPGVYTVTVGPVLPGYPATSSASVSVSSAVTTTANIGLQPQPGLSVKNVRALDNGGNANGDGAIDPGENSIDLDVALGNMGAANATGVSATVAPQTPGVSMNAAVSAYPDINTSATQTNTVKFNFAVAPTVTCGAPLAFQVDAITDQGASSADLTVPTGAPPVLTAAISDNVENGGQGWTTGGTNNTWAITSEASHSPVNSWTDSPSGNYQNNTNSWLQSQALDLSAFDTVTMTFWHIYSLESKFDFGFVEYSLDGGSTWNPAAEYTGSGNTWKQETLDLSALAHQSNVRVRFRISMDNGVTSDGWHLDDIVISGGKRLCSLVHLNPGIAVEPTELSVSSLPSAVTTRTLTISSTGGLALTFSLAESPGVTWLDELPTNGTVVLPGSRPILLTFTAPKVAGVYTTTLQIGSNDPFNGLVTVPVTLTVAHALYLPILFDVGPLSL